MNLRKMQWCEDAREALRPAMLNDSGEQRIRAAVQTGDAELWRVTAECFGEFRRAWLVTEVFDNMLWVWVYSGDIRFFDVAVHLAGVAHENNLARMGWYSFHLRAMRRYFARYILAVHACDEPDMLQFEIDQRGLYACQSTAVSHSANNFRAHGSGADPAGCSAEPRGTVRRSEHGNLETTGERSTEHGPSAISRRLNPQDADFLNCGQQMG